MKIILFRHGEKQRLTGTNGDISKIHLTKNGINQIKKLGNVLKKRFPNFKNYPVIYSSPYARSVQSAQIVQSILKIKEIIQIPEFAEFIAYTNYQTDKDFREHLQSLAMQNPNWISPETHSSLNQIISNFENKLKEICSQDTNKFILVSTHGAIIRNTVYSLDPKFRPTNDLIAQAKIHQAGYTILNFDGQKFSVDEFNVHDFLD